MSFYQESYFNSGENTSFFLSFFLFYISEIFFSGEPFKQWSLQLLNLFLPSSTYLIVE